MRKDRQEKHDRLCRLINEVIEANEPQTFEGYNWAILPQSEWCKLLGVSDRTLRELIKITPICKTTTKVEGQKTVLLRVGVPDPKDTLKAAKVMADLFFKNTGKKPTEQERGMLRGLAQQWPLGAETQIFQCVLNLWPEFMAGVKLEVERMLYAGEKAFNRFYKYPSISVILRFHQVAVELYTMQLQHDGKLPPPALQKFHPELWKHLGNTNTK